ncbi:MAG: hypothetical protein AB7I27_01530 [Bacteriovoracaceae bacterium]
MRSIFVLFILFLTNICRAQDTAEQTRIIDAQRTLSAYFSLPFTINTHGELDFLQNVLNSTFGVNPMVQMGLFSEKFQYFHPTQQNEFSFSEPNSASLMTEYKRFRFEGGLGLAALMIKEVIGIGLTPYRGAFKFSVRTIKPDKKELDTSYLPTNLEDIRNWTIGDFVYSQVYGGIQGYIGLGASILDLTNATIELRNQFIIGIKKLSETTIKICIGEESLNKRQLIIGPVFLDSIGATIKGNRVNFDFTLNIENEEHNKLYHALLAGDIQKIQKSLPHISQKISWVGDEVTAYVGIPWIMGRTVSEGDYTFNDNNEETRVHNEEKYNNGYLTFFRNYQNLSFTTKNSIALVWSAEMKRTRINLLKKVFLSIGRILNAKGFFNSSPNRYLGSVITKLGISFERSELEQIRYLDNDQLRDILRQKCDDEELSCSSKRKSKKIIKKLKEIVVRPWSESKDELGKLLLEEPAMIYAIIKSLELKKQLYFKFLSDRYQSLEGKVPMEI